MASIARQIFPGFFFPQSWASSTIQQHGITGSTMATVCLDHQLFYNPPATADPKPASHGLLVWKGVPSTPIFRAPLHPPLPQDPHSPHHGGTGRSRDDALLILSDDDPDDSRSDAEVESGSMAGTGRDVDVLPAASCDSDGKETSSTCGADPDDQSASTPQRQTHSLERSPAPLSPIPAGSRAKLHGHELQHDPRPSTQVGGMTSNLDGTICLPDDVWDEKYPYSFPALRRRRQARRTNESAGETGEPDQPPLTVNSDPLAQSPRSAFSDHEGETQQRSDKHPSQCHHHQCDSDQTSDPEHHHPPVPDNREQNVEGSAMPPQPRESRANTPTLPDDENTDLDGLHPNTTAAEAPLAEGEQDQEQNDIRSPLRRPTATPALTGITRTGTHIRSQGPRRVDAGTDNYSPAISDDHENSGDTIRSQGSKRRRTRAPRPHGSSEARLGKLIQGAETDSDGDRSDDERPPPSLDGSEAEQDEDIDEEYDERPPAPKRQKANRDPSEAEALAKPGRRGDKVRHGGFRSPHMLSVDPGDERGAGKQSDQDRPRRRPARRRRDGPRDEEDEEGDNICPPPPKRHKASSLTTLASLRTRRHLRSHDAASQPQVRASASGRTQSGRHNVFSSRSSQGSINEGNDQDPRAMFEEWPLGNAVLKRVIVDGLATFQLQFTWDPRAMHKREDCAAGQPQDKSRINGSGSLRRGGGAESPLTPEDNLLIELKSQGLSWKEIHRRFTQAFPDRKRSMGSLQVHYCTKVKRRQ